MSFPAGGMESAFRNDIDEVAYFMKDTHRDNFMIYNLSERDYDYTKFNNQVCCIGHCKYVIASDTCGQCRYNLGVAFQIITPQH